LEHPKFIEIVASEAEVTEVTVINDFGTFLWENALEDVVQQFINAVCTMIFEVLV
jgi:hypothetical protein